MQRWAERQQPDPDWIADPLFGRLPQRFAAIRDNLNLSRLKFELFDISTLREAIWVRDLARQIESRELHDQPLADWLQQHTSEIGETPGQDLRLAVAIFDWVVRNIQLEAIPTPGTAADNNVDGQPPNSMIPPPGAKYLPIESLLLGRGDWIVRSRIAILIARQVGIPFVMLGVENDAEPTPWCLAALIERQLYLFDMRLGLPIPLEEGQGIATLENVIDRPELLRALDLAGSAAYPIAAADLPRIVAMIEATPEYLSQRMKLIESRLTGDRKLTLTCQPSSLSLDLRACRGLGSTVSLWTVPYDTYLFRQQLRQLPDYMIQMQQERGLVDGPTPLANGRRQHFRGIYADTDSEEGAKSYYLSCRVPDSDIALMNDTKQFQQILGAVGQTLEDEQAQRQLLESLRTMIRKSKEYASYWLGLIAFEEGKYEMAENYFLKRTLQAKPDGIWTQGARYNLARTHEQLGWINDDSAQFVRAREYYLLDADSPQAAGNQLRAQRLPTIE